MFFKYYTSDIADDINNTLNKMDDFNMHLLIDTKTAD